MKLLDVVALIQDCPELGLYCGNVGTDIVTGKQIGRAHV